MDLCVLFTTGSPGFSRAVPGTSRWQTCIKRMKDKWQGPSHRVWYLRAPFWMEMDPPLLPFCTLFSSPLFLLSLKLITNPWEERPRLLRRTGIRWSQLSPAHLQESAHTHACDSVIRLSEGPLCHPAPCLCYGSYMGLNLVCLFVTWAFVCFALFLAFLPAR